MEAGVGFECVSPGEVDYVLKLMPTLDCDSILFTPNFCGMEEYDDMLKVGTTCSSCLDLSAPQQRGVNVTVDNIFCIEQFPEVFAGHNIFVRIDTGGRHGHHGMTLALCTFQSDRMC